MDDKKHTPELAVRNPAANAIAIEEEIQWFSQVLDARFNLYFGNETAVKDIQELHPPKLDQGASTLGKLIDKYELGFAERLVLMLAMMPHIRPQILDLFFIKNANYDRGFTEFGGLKGNQHSGFLPTGETAAFVLGGTSLEARFALMTLFEEEHAFHRKNILYLDGSHQKEPSLSGLLRMNQESLLGLTEGKPYRPAYSSAFPARRIETKLDWQDLVLRPGTIAEVKQINAWIKHGQELMDGWKLSRVIKPGYRSLFYGPPGTGKTLTASLLGKSNQLDVYKIDLSQVVSKYIGETEKNLAQLFDQAENRDWILFFDEADALFGKRSQTKDAHDRYANQEVSYLLQRIESFNGVVILASNLKNNLDDAFMRRFQSVIFFPMPGPSERLRLWQQSFSPKSELEKGLNLHEVAQEFEMAGGAIINVVRYASLQAIQRGEQIIRLKDIRKGIRKELRKEGKVL